MDVRSRGFRMVRPYSNTAMLDNKTAMLDNLSHYHIILASKSPRRRELLAGLGLEFETRIIPGIAEDYPENLSGEEIPQFISREKANAYRDSLKEDDLLITADTIVYAAGLVLGKPHDADDAHRMLKLLSGKTHQVVTGVSLTTTRSQYTFASVTDVTFATLTDEEINFYTERYRPFDKAGAYGIQEWIGYIGVTRIEGSFYNVMGLPVQRLYGELKKM